MIAPFIALAKLLGVTEGFQRAAAWVLALIALAIAIGALWAVHANWVDHRVDTGIAIDRARDTGAVMTNAAAAERAGAAVRRATEQGFANTQDDYRKAIDDAQGNDASPLDALGERMRR